MRAGIISHSGRPTRTLLVVALVLALLASLSPTVTAADVVTHGSRDRRWVALTFDDGWNAEHCARIADTLRDRNVTATFFPNGTYVRRAPSRWRAILHGFVVANHTYSHAWLDRLSSASIRREISLNEQTLEAALGRPLLHLLRPPYGAYDAQVVQVAHDLGYGLVLWDVDGRDTMTSSVSSVVHEATRGTNGSIVLLHCGPSVTPAAIDAIISAYRSRGFGFVDLATMLGQAVSLPARSCHVRNARSGVVHGSLRSAVRAASSGDRLVLRGTCRGTTTIGKSLTLRGVRKDGSGIPTLAGMDHGPVLTIGRGVSVKLTGLTVRGGASARAAGMLNLGRLTLKDVVVRGNEARESGGAVVNKGRLTLSGGTSIRGNRARVVAGGVLNRGRLTMFGTSAISGNVAGRAGGVFDSGDLVGVVCGGNVRNNSPDDCGGE